MTDDLSKSGRLKAGDLVGRVAAVMDGRGGGKPSMAQGGGDPGKLDHALREVPDIIALLLDEAGS